MGFIQEFQRAKISEETEKPVHRDPCLHIRSENTEPLKGWSPFYQPLPAPRLALSPYIGCVARCEFCFLRSFPGLHRLGTEEMILTVYTDYAEHLKNYLVDLRVAPPAVLSPFTDPFQPIDDRYGQAEKLIQVCVLHNLPLDIVTRYHVPDEALAMLEYLTHSRIQISVDPLETEGEVPYVLERLDVLERIKKLGLNPILRLDPLVPGQSELDSRLEWLVSEAQQRDLEHLVTRFIQVPAALHEEYVSPDETLYEPHPDRQNWWVVRTEVKEQILTRLSELVRAAGMTLGVLGEPSLQDQFGSFARIYPDYLPLSFRVGRGDKFVPVEGCRGDCQQCEAPHCGLEELWESPWREERLTTSDWKRWSRNHLQKELLE